MLTREDIVEKTRANYVEGNPIEQPAGPSSLAFEESNRLIGTQAALVAGFAFAGLTVINYDPSTPRYLVSAFGIACAMTIALELLALCGSGKLSIMGKRHQFGEHLTGNNLKAAYLNLFGLLAFVLAVNILVWIKFGWPVRMIVLSIFGLMVVVAYIWHLKLERLTDAHRDVEEITETVGQSPIDIPSPPHSHS
jgi:hypothetical protein